MDARARVFDLTANDPSKPTLLVPHRPEFLNRPNLIPIRFLDGGRTLLTIPTFNVVAGFDPATGAERFRVTYPPTVMDLAVAPDGKTFWTGGESALAVWSADGTWKPGAVAHRNDVVSLAPLPNGSGLVTASRDRVIRVVDAAGATALHPALPHTTSIWAVACTPDGEQIATASEDGLIRVWQLPAVPPVRDVPLAQKYSLARFGPGGRTLLPVGGSFVTATLRQLRLHHPSTGDPLSPAFDTGGVLLDADLSPDGHVLATASTPLTPAERPKKMHGPGAGEIRFWDATTGRPIGPPLPTPSEPRSVRFRPDGKEVVAVCATGQLLVLDPAGAVRHVWSVEQAQDIGRHYVNNGAVRYSGDGQMVYVYGLSARITALDPETGRPRFSI
jgi:WD40 repeat protein